MKPTILALMGAFNPDDLGNDIAGQEKALKKTIKGDDRFVTAAYDTVRHYCVINTERGIIETLREKYDEYTMFNGERPPVPGGDPAEWDSGLDDAVAEVFAPHVESLSADWLGKNTVDCRLHEDGEVAKLARNFANEVWKNVTTGKAPLAALAEANVSLEWVRYVCTGSTEAPEADTPPSFDMGGVVETLKAILAVAGEAFDPMALYDELDNASDTDDVLAIGAMQRLVPHVDESGHRYYALQLQNFRACNAEAPDKLLEMLTALATNPSAYDNLPTAVVDDVPLPSERKSRSRPKKSEPQEAPLGAMDHRILALLKDHANVADKELAEKIGVSRATMNNHVNGKTPFIPSDAQRDYIRNTVWEHLEGLLEAFSRLDGVQYVVKADDGSAE